MSESAFTVWGGLIAAALLAIAALALLTVSRSGDDQPSRVRTADCARLLAEATELDEFAAAAFTKAIAASDAAAHTAVDLENAQTARDEAGRTQDTTARALEEAVGSLEAAQTLAPAPAEARGQREASRAAMAAYRRGAISVDQLRALWQQIDGWDQQQEDQARELTRLRAEDAEARRRYDAAALTERTARQANEVAQIATRALTQEAADAAQEAQLAHLAAQECLRRAGRLRR